MNLDTDFTHFKKINSKSILSLNVKHKTIKLLEDNRSKLDELQHSGAFLGTIPKV